MVHPRSRIPMNLPLPGVLPMRRIMTVMLILTPIHTPIPMFPPRNADPPRPRPLSHRQITLPCMAANYHSYTSMVLTVAPAAYQDQPALTLTPHNILFVPQ
jgi:hypothetical protein